MHSILNMQKKITRIYNILYMKIIQQKQPNQSGGV